MQAIYCFRFWFTSGLLALVGTGVRASVASMSSRRSLAKTPAGVRHWPKVVACAAVSTDFSLRVGSRIAPGAATAPVATSAAALIAPVVNRPSDSTRPALASVSDWPAASRLANCADDFAAREFAVIGEVAGSEGWSGRRHAPCPSPGSSGKAPRSDRARRGGSNRAQESSTVRGRDRHARRTG